MLETVTCWVPVCDTCGESYGQNAEGIVHFDAPAEAHRYLTDSRIREHDDGLDYQRDPDDPGWQHLPGGLLRCEGCEIERLCRSHGHDWSHWRRCRGVGFGHILPNGPCPGHVRNCWRCRRQQHHLPGEEVATR